MGRVLSSTPPRIGVTWNDTVQLSGTRISIPPHTANTSIVASPLIAAWRRSISQPPITAVRSPPRNAGELLPRLTPLRMAIADRTE